MLTITDRGTIDRLVRDLQGHAQRKVVLRQLRKRMRQPLPAARKGVRAAAVEQLPRAGGLGVWVAKTRITANLRVTARAVRLTVKGSRRKDKKLSDIRRIDAGTVRHPTFGRRTGAYDWHNQAVPEGFFTKTISERYADEWRRVAVEAAEAAVAELSGGG
jgi:hypothetical protein